MENYKKMVANLQEVNDISKAIQVLQWDRETNMPRAGSIERTHQVSTLRKIAHEKGTSAEFTDMLAAAAQDVVDLDADSDEVRLVALVQRLNGRQRKLTTEIVQRLAQAEGAATSAWIKARADNDFESFRPHLETNVELAQETAELYGYENELYDALLSGYEYGTSTAEVRTIFDAVKAEIVPLLQAIIEKGRPIDDSVLYQPFAVDKQEKFAREIATAVGYDFSRGHLGEVVHPFMTNFSQNDVRITTRWYPEFLSSGLFSVLHEAGHALYEQGTHPSFSRTPLASGTSLGIHESQSRSIENLVGRSRPFWERHYPQLQATFPDQLGSTSVDDFYRAINKVQPSFIRVEADELTYNFHIILRFELEQALLSGDLAVKDLPAAWAEKMQSLVGVTPDTDSNGCLQDVHWTRPSAFGYFPTYALGGYYGAQFMEAMTEQDPTIADQLSTGDPSGMVNWLRENIHTPGSKFPPGELVVRATGRPLSHEPFVRYAKKKFGAIYEL